MPTAIKAIPHVYLVVKSLSDGDYFLTRTGNWSANVIEAGRFDPAHAYELVRLLGPATMALNISVFESVRQTIEQSEAEPFFIDGDNVA